MLRVKIYERSWKFKMIKRNNKKILFLLIPIIIFLAYMLLKLDNLNAKLLEKSANYIVELPATEPSNLNALNVNPQNFSFVGDAGSYNYPSWTNTVEMAPKALGKKGALWYKEKVSIKKDFEGEFELYLGNNYPEKGMDGITLTFQNDSDIALGGSANSFGVVGPSDPGNPSPGDVFIKNAVSIIFDGQGDEVGGGGQGAVYLVVPCKTTGGVRAISNFNIMDSTTSFSSGKWMKVRYYWDATNQILEYEVTGPVWKSGTSAQQTIDFKTGMTSGTYQHTNSNIIPEIAEAAQRAQQSGKTPAEEYFKSDTIWWGYTGTSHGTNIARAIDPVVSVGLLPNQFQSPLQLSMTKYEELGAGGERQPLSGAKFILQAQDENGTWRQFNPEKGEQDIAEVFTTDTNGKIVIKAIDGQQYESLINMVLKYGGTERYQAFRFREVEAPTGYIQPPVISPMNPNDYAASESEHSAGLFSSKSVELSGASTTPSNPTPENPDDGDFGTVSNIHIPTEGEEAMMIHLTKTGAENKPLSGVEMTIGAKVTDMSGTQRILSLAQLSNSVKNTKLTETQMTLITDDHGKISVPENQLAMMLDLASSSLDVYRSLDQWVFIETKVATGYQPSPFLDGNWQEVPEAYKNKFIFNITDNWTSAEDIKSEYPVTAANALNQFTISPEAIGPEDEPLADASFTINDTPISNPYALTVGTAASAPTYTLKQTNTNDGYASAQPVTFKLVQTPNKINEFTVTTVTVEGNNTDNYFEFYYKVGEEKKSITPGTPFTSSDFLENPTLFLSLVNQPIGDFALAQIEEPLNYGRISLPQKNPDELIKRQGANWKVQFTDTRLEAYRTPLKLSVRLDQNFTNTNDPTKTISGILLYRPEATTPITPNDFLIEGEETPIKEKINPESGTNDIDWPEQAGFLLQIDAEKQTKIFAGDYQAELTFILSEDPL